jgi:hypothetical protein
LLLALQLRVALLLLLAPVLPAILAFARAFDLLLTLLLPTAFALA